MNTSLTESFGIAILEAACAGLYVVSTRVGGVPEVLPEDMISFALPEEDGKTNLFFKRVCFSYNLEDIVGAMAEAVRRVAAGLHDPHAAHARIREFYNWKDVATRTERVYEFALTTPKTDLWTRIKRFV